MKFNYVILGAGRQGVALAYDLARNCDAERITLIDSDAKVVAKAIERLRMLLAGSASSLDGQTCDVSQVDTVKPHLKNARVVISAVPYRFNVALTDAAIDAGACFCDLGGNTKVVRDQLSRHERAAEAGISIVPDCGLAPGLGNHLAAHGVQSLDEPMDVAIRCGGLPEKPVGPLGYKLVFNFQGLINEYSGVGEFLRDGRKAEVAALTEVEDIEFASPVGRCEAAVTSGGTSTCPDTYLGKLRGYDYKTVRYPGHFAAVRAMFLLGCFEEKVTFPDGTVVEPKAMMRRLMEQRLAYPDVRDIVVLRVVVRGMHEGEPATLQYDLYDRLDEATGFSAMERTTAFPAALVAHMQARGLVAPGAAPLEVAVPAQQYVDELPTHDIHVEINRS